MNSRSRSKLGDVTDMHFLKQPNVEKLQNQLIHGRISRRQFVQATAVAGLAPVASSMAPSSVRADADDLSYFTWSGYEVPELHQPYIDEHGGSPGWSVFASAEDGLQKIRAGFQTDITHPCVDNVPKWQAAGVIQPIDPSRVSYWDDMFPALHTMTGAVVVIKASLPKRLTGENIKLCSRRAVRKVSGPQCDVTLEDTGKMFAHFGGGFSNRNRSGDVRRAI